MEIQISDFGKTKSQKSEKSPISEWLAALNIPDNVIFALIPILGENIKEK